jgi:hypothetical protein
MSLRAVTCSGAVETWQTAPKLAEGWGRRS